MVLVHHRPCCLCSVVMWFMVLAVLGGAGTSPSLLPVLSGDVVHGPCCPWWCWYINVLAVLGDGLRVLSRRRLLLHVALLLRFCNAAAAADTAQSRHVAITASSLSSSHQRLVLSRQPHQHLSFITTSQLLSGTVSLRASSLCLYMKRVFNHVDVCHVH